MKTSRLHNKSGTYWLLTALLVVEIIILGGLVTILFMIARDYFMPDKVLARNSSSIHNPTPHQTVTAYFNATLTPVKPTAFKPKPTVTIPPTSVKTAVPGVTQTEMPVPTELPTPEQEWPPKSAQISNILGYTQAFTLDCESRSAVDWAAYFGVTIGEIEFLEALPRSDDPNIGFVGDPNGVGGLIPPDSYGVHAAPIAKLLRAYGLPAKEVYGLSRSELQSEIASGRPVIAWVIVGTGFGYSLEYITEAGEIIDVAPYEHTVIVIGYDANGVTILDGGMVYRRDWTTFDTSFGVLDNMAVIYRQ